MKEIRNKKIINSIIGFVLFFVILFGGFWLIDNLFTKELKAQEVNIINLASPDLTDKEYLGNGWYQIQLGSNYDRKYNVYTGEWFLNGAFPSLFIGNEMIVFEIDTLKNYVLTPTLISGTHNGTTDFIFRTQEQNYMSINSGNVRTINNSNSLQWRSNLDGLIYDNAIIKFQLEQGTIATTYQVPIGALEQHIQLEKEKSYNEGYEAGYNEPFENENSPIYNTNIDIPSYDMSNDVWLDGNMISDVYYRYDIIYNGITYNFFDDIRIAYENGTINAKTLLYIDLDPMYNFIFTKLEDQGNGLYNWTELGTLNPEQATYIKTIIINKNGLSFKNDNYNGYWQEYLWDDFSLMGNILGWQLVGYENQVSLDYYDYNNGYQDGYWDGRNYGFKQGQEVGYNTGYSLGHDDGYDLGYDRGYDDGFDYGQDIAYDLGFDDGYDDGYDVGLNESLEAGGFSMLLSSMFTAVGTLLAIELLPNIYLGMFVAVPLVFGVIMFIIGKRKDD